MTVRKITDLRKSGHIRKAYELAEELLKSGNTQKEEIPAIKKAMGWVLFDYLKIHVTAGNSEKTQKILRKIDELGLDDTNTDLFDQFAWKTGKEVFHLASSLKKRKGQGNVKDAGAPGNADLHPQLQAIFSFCRKYPPRRPSREHSFLLSAFLSAWKKEKQFLDFAEWWDFENFLREDFKETELRDGKKVSALAERALLACADALLNTASPGKLRPGPDMERLERFLCVLDKITREHPQFMFAVYSKAKLLHALGRNREALTAVLPFARNNTVKYWLWDFLGDLHSEDQELKMACYCKALAIKTPEKFISKIHLKLADLCIRQNLFPEAKTELDRYLEIRSKYGWNVSGNAAEWTKATWYKQTTARSENHSFYLKRAEKAMTILHGDIPELPIVVTHLHNTKRILYFQKGRDEHGFLNYGMLSYTPAVGDIMLAKMRAEGTNGYHKLLDARPAELSELSPQDFMREYEGKVSIHKKKSFGFVDNAEIRVFIPPDILQETEITNNQNVIGLAIASFDKKKKRWGWSAISLMTTSQRQ